MLLIWHHMKLDLQFFIMCILKSECEFSFSISEHTQFMGLVVFIVKFEVECNNTFFVNLKLIQTITVKTRITRVCQETHKTRSRDGTDYPTS